MQETIFHTARSPDQTLAAVRAALAADGTHGTGRRRAGQHRVRGTVRKNRFRVWLERDWIGGEGDSLEMRGEVQSTPEGGTVVRTTAGREHAPWTGVLLFGGMAGLTLLAGTPGAWLFLALAALAGVAALRGRRSAPSDADTLYLIRWIENALTDDETRPPQP